jgi:hypothetical protein
MTRPRQELGDSHNFGRRVTLGAERVAKPRTLLWEWLLLAGESPFRRLLERTARADGLAPETFAFLPSLGFFRARSGRGGEVERIVLTPLGKPSSESRVALAAIGGRAIALFSWLGVSDLHWENLVLGLDARGRPIFTPLDVEMIFADLALPTETKLIPDADPEYAAICRHAAGIRRLLPYLGKPLAAPELLSMLGAYHATLAFLERHTSAIAEVFSAVPGLREAPIRICLRGTEEYVRAGREPLWPPLLEAELEQLERGDIPYFFRLYGRRGIHYYANPELTQLKSLPQKGDVPQLDPILQLSRGLRSPSRKQLRDDGLFTVLGAFDHAALRGRYRSEAGLEVSFGARSLLVKLPSGEELRSRRNLSAFVASVYLPCRCGEVRTVFVPAVTRCASS